ncbi:hypothetical protein MUY27_18215 [Mucilaginibacter sp. RS28]|uniref:Uncharacterized protein n=1 Tax=Mucilaginibacter straminoryzae TaxID=2932774 RepID=A0A9X1X5Y6_9SPHI|nr:hypothetical protein [Mucilaginibacter straminoryzae]MCJ8211659.1 hypothetical protein [Mucilaginibacter straminoryzae]
MKIKNWDHPVFQVVGEGALSSTVIGEGRFIPLLIIDPLGHQEIKELISVHRNLPPGDAIFRWSSSIWNRKKIYLTIEFMKPMKTSFAIVFDTQNENALIEGIIQSRGFILQVGKTGDKPSSTQKEDKVLLEVPDLGFDFKWNTILTDVIKSKYKKMGLSKKEINIATKEHIKSMREVWAIRR